MDVVTRFYACDRKRQLDDMRQAARIMLDVIEKALCVRRRAIESAAVTSARANLRYRLVKYDIRIRA